jgi:hypothetical protein
MESFWEIVDRRDGDVIQRLAVLTTPEVDALRANGYTVNHVTLDRRLFGWLLIGREER